AIVGASYVVQHFLLSAEPRLPLWVVSVPHVVQFVLMLAAVVVARPKGLVPKTKAERLLWAVWVGYVVACVMQGHLIRLLFGEEWVYNKAVLPFTAVLSGLAFFILGSSYWGMLYAVAAAFFALAYLTYLTPYWAALEYAAVWSATLCVIG